MGFFGIELRPATAMTFSIALGIAVDDTIHFLSRFRSEYLLTKSHEKSTTTTILTTGRQLGTSITLGMGFLVLIFSNFKPNFEFGILATIILIVALLSSLILLPALINIIKPLNKSMNRNKIYKDIDVTKDHILNKTVGIIGYGSQARAQALNLRDSGAKVLISRANSKSINLAKKDAFKDILSITNLCIKADIISILIPDEEIPNVYINSIEPNLEKVKLYYFLMDTLFTLIKLIYQRESM